MRVSKSYIKGFARIFDIYGKRKDNVDISHGFETDYNSLRGDWLNVGKDIEKGIRYYQQTIAER